MLRNLWLVGYIHMLLPQACILHVVRHPMDVAMSCYAQPFGYRWGCSAGFGASGAVAAAALMHSHGLCPPLSFCFHTYSHTVSGVGSSAMHTHGAHMHTCTHAHTSTLQLLVLTLFHISALSSSPGLQICTAAKEHATPRHTARVHHACAPGADVVDSRVVPRRCLSASPPLAAELQPDPRVLTLSLKRLPPALAPCCLCCMDTVPRHCRGRGTCQKSRPSCR